MDRFNNINVFILTIFYNVILKGQKKRLYEENNSVVHHNYCDSKLSDRTPSYGQLNYNEKIAKFFSSELQINNDFRASFDTVNSNGQNFDNKTSPSHHNCKFDVF